MAHGTTDTSSASTPARNVLSWLLLLLAAATIVAAVVVSWARGVVFDRHGFRATIASVLVPPATRRAIVDLTLDAALGGDEEMAAVAGATLAEPLTEALGSEAFRSFLDGASDLTFEILVARGDEDIRIDATEIRDLALELAGEDAEQDWVEELRATPTPFVITVAEAEVLPSLAPYRANTRWLPFLLLAVSFMLGVLGVRLAVDRGAAAGRFVLLVTLLAALVALLTWWAPGWIGAEALRPAERVLIEGGGRALTSSLRSRLLIVVVAGGLMLLLRWRVLTNVRDAASKGAAE